MEKFPNSHATPFNRAGWELGQDRSTEMSNQIILIPLLLFLYLPSSSSSDTLTSSQLLTGNQTLISAGQKFELGFFSPDGADANKLYLGIWYFNLPVKTIAWIANRDFPARNSSVSLKLGIGGQIVLSEQGAAAVWSSSHSNATNPILQLLDSGNLVVRDADDSNAENYVWQSFDYPTDTLLPGQKLGWDKKSGLDRYLTSWKSSIDPSSGDYMFRLDRAGDPQLCIIINGSQIIFRTGPWVGQRFSGVPPMNSSPTITFTFQDNPDEAVYYEVNEADPTMRSRLFVDPRGTLRRYTWEADTWNVYWFAPKDQCDQYMACGPYGLCDASGLFVCGCPQGFGPKDPSAWAQRDASSGCARKTRLDCATDGFVVLGGMKLPDSVAAVVDKEKGLKECRETCRKDCNCTAFASWQVVNGVGSGCLMWTGDLKDMRKYPENGQDLYVRVDASDVDDSDKTKKVAIGVSVSVGLVMILLAVAACFVCKRKHPLPSNYRVSRLGVRVSSKRALAIDNEADELELPLYDFESVLVATNHFSHQNKLGEGGFGHVYKGVLKEGEEVAIKRLSRDSGQGVEEFKNEVMLIAKLQHRNLVRLLGCCLEAEEKMLVYEYLPNRSLDTVLFHKERHLLLDWTTRFNIICGVARGLQYLHHDSRLRIIHRDLKSSNVLLDGDMNPKISDFGMARIFGGDETALKNTRRVVGTYGYMAPEYAMYGAFSIKSDVFSFGVLVLEIVTGKANTRFYNSHDELNLLGYAWKMWNEGKGRELLDPCIGDSYSQTEVERCIQIGLLCVQERAEERPNMSSVVVALSSQGAALAQPQLPGFCLGRRPGAETDSSSSQHKELFSANQITVSVIDGR